MANREARILGVVFSAILVALAVLAIVGAPS